MGFPKPTMLLILDGWGLSDEKKGNAISAAETPVFDSLWEDYPHSRLGASGESIGLPPGQMGGSEVGHLTIGAGRVVFRGLTQISAAVHEGSFFENEVLLEALQKAKDNDSRLHLMGLLSDEGVHSMDSHLFALMKMAEEHGVKEVCVHAFLDGRDSPPTSGVKYLNRLLSKIEELGVGELCSIIGRYYAMDRDTRWERTKKAYDLLVEGEGEGTVKPVERVKQFYNQDVTDEFMEPIKVKDTPTISDDDVVIMYNFRPDRARQITWAFTEEDFNKFERSKFPQVHYVCMTPYHEDIQAPAAFRPREIKNGLGEVLSRKGLKQLRIAETEKYAHVTFFFSGGREDEFPGEDRILIPSPREVGTYDKKPEMSAYPVTEAVLKAIEQDRFDFIIMNLANPDMVGHTGVFKAAVRAVEVVDECLSKIFEKIKEKKGQLLIIADHGNADEMMEDDGDAITAHSMNPVPCILVSDREVGLRDGSLLDVAPTLLELMDLDVPSEMTGESLIK